MTKECDEPIMKLRTDNGGEYLSKEFQAYLASNGIEHQLTVPHSPQQNGVAEWLNRTLVESARAMLSHSNLPNRFWAEELLPISGIVLPHLPTKSNSHLMRSGMVTSRTSVISRCLGVLPIVMCQMHKEENLTRRHEECVLLVIVKILKDTD